MKPNQHRQATRMDEEGANVDELREFLTDAEFEGLFYSNGGRVRSGPGGKQFILMPLKNFKHIVRSLLAHAHQDRKLLAALIDQEGGALMLAKRYAEEAQPRGLSIEVDEVSGAQTIRHLSS